MGWRLFRQRMAPSETTSHLTLFALSLKHLIIPELEPGGISPLAPVHIV